MNAAAAVPLVDVGLAQRLERAEAHANAMFVESRARRMPASGACWMSVGGTFAMFDGVGSPLTQTFGLGVYEPVTPDALESIESFFLSRGSDAFNEVSPLADPSALALLNERGYRPCELTSVLYRPISPAAVAHPPQDGPFAVVVASPAQQVLWADTALRGWSEFAEVREFMTSFGPTAAGAEDAYPFIAFDSHQAVATGMLAIHGGVALLAGASTVPEARGRGAQRALLRARLRLAADRGCTLAMMCAGPGSGSQRNAERQGFRIAYTRIKWHRPRQGKGR
jgi:GNAT superfamily N-acetyltransferase